MKGKVTGLKKNREVIEIFTVKVAIPKSNCKGYLIEGKEWKKAFAEREYV